VFSIIGPNGAGKTTLFNVFSGLYLPQGGRVLLAGEDVTGLAPHRLARRGLSRTFQNLQIFFRMTAHENVMVVLVEHDMRLVMNISDRIHVLANGRTLAEGSAAEVRSNPAVVQAYLGVHGSAEAAVG